MTSSRSTWRWTPNAIAPTNIAAMKALWKDTHERLAIDDTRVYATGFSGGARVANIMGQVLGLAGVIAVGGGYPPSSPPRRACTC